mgnify:CR=1 FL=1
MEVTKNVIVLNMNKRFVEVMSENEADKYARCYCHHYVGIFSNKLQAAKYICDWSNRILTETHTDDDYKENSLKDFSEMMLKVLDLQ